MLVFQVKLAHSEMTLHSALGQMTITKEELDLIRAHARLLSSVEPTDISTVIPLILAIYVFEVLCSTHIRSYLLSNITTKFAVGCQPTDQDEQLGFASAIRTLGIMRFFTLYLI